MKSRELLQRLWDRWNAPWDKQHPGWDGDLEYVAVEVRNECECYRVDAEDCRAHSDYCA